MNYDFDSYFNPRSYYNCGNVRKEFLSEFITLWPYWLGDEATSELDNVTIKDWSKFNQFIRLVGCHYDIFSAEHSSRRLKPISDLLIYLSGYRDSMNKSSKDFSDFVIPEIGCVIQENWDYTYILRHKNFGALETLSPLIKQVGLHHFSKNKLRSKR